jgi:hypothetical protein
VEASSERPDATRRVQPPLLALSLLTLVTGLVDAACYLGLGRVFTANITGNVVLLAFGAAGAQGLPVLAPTVSLLVFLVGATAGGRLASSMIGPAGAEVPAPLGHRHAAGGAAAGRHGGGGGDRPAGRRWWRSAVRGDRVAGGGAGAAERDCAPPGRPRRHHDGAHPDPDRACRRLLARRRPQPRAGRRVAAVGLMAAGALGGALLLRVDVALPLLAAAVLVALAAVGLRFGR